MNNSEDKILASIVDTIVKVADPDKIILFGSRASGNAKQDSDYDFLVLKKHKWKRNDRNFATRIRSRIDVLAPIDILVSTPNRFEKNKKNTSMIYHEADQNGKVVYEKK